jgi:hypothetical protein
MDVYKEFIRQICQLDFECRLLARLAERYRNFDQWVDMFTVIFTPGSAVLVGLAQIPISGAWPYWFRIIGLVLIVLASISVVGKKSVLAPRMKELESAKNAAEKILQQFRLVLRKSESQNIRTNPWREMALDAMAQQYEYTFAGKFSAQEQKAAYDLVVASYQRYFIQAGF